MGHGPPGALRVVFVSMHTSPVADPGSGDVGGMNVVESALADALADRGHQVEMITRRADTESPDIRELRPGVTLRQVSAGPPTPLPKSVIDDHIDEFAAGLRAVARPDIVHSHHWMSGVAAMAWAREMGVPHVQSFHSVAAPPNRPLSDGEPPESPRRARRRTGRGWSWDTIVAISVAEARTVVDRCGADPDRVVIVRPGVDLDLFHPAEGNGAASAGATGDNGYVMFIARLQPLKGPDLALRALSHIEQWQRPHLLVTGDVSEDFAEYAAELHELVRRLGLSDFVTFTGAVDRPHLAHLLRDAELLLVPSHSETFGLVALEAAASGVPVLAAAAGGLREAVAHQETGQLIDSREPEDWGRAMRHVLHTPGLRASMGRAARIHARRFEWRWSAARLEDVYGDLLGRST